MLADHWELVSAAGAAAAWIVVSRVASVIEQRWAEHLGGAIAGLLVAVLNPKSWIYSWRYRRRVRRQVTALEEVGLSRLNPVRLSLDDVFVEPSLTLQMASSGVVDPTRRVSRDRSESLDTWLDERSPGIVAVTGGPGFGKSTLLQHTAHVHATGQDGRRRLPVRLILRRHATPVVTANGDLALADLLDLVLPADGLPKAPQGWWQRQLRRGRCLLLLDGLDEVADEEDRRLLLSWVEAETTRYDRIDVVLSSRPDGLAVPPTRTLLLQLRPFSPDRVHRFMVQWYEAVYRKEQGTKLPVPRRVRSRARRSADDLYHQLHRTPALVRFAENPLLLMMIINVHQRGIKKGELDCRLPESRVELYDLVLRTLLEERQQAKNIRTSPLRGKLDVLAFLAYAMTQEDNSLEYLEMKEESVLRWMDATMTTGKPRDFLRDVRANGILVETRPGIYAFAHRSIQEYLAATYLRDGTNLEVLLGAVNNSWWLGTMRFYAEIASPLPIIKACIASDTPGALALAIACGRQTSTAISELLDPLRPILEAATDEARTADDRRAIAGAFVMEHQDLTGETEFGTAICLRPVAWWLYRFFLADTCRRSPDGPAPGVVATDRPVTGIRRAEAAAFVEWINGLPSTMGVRFRLPMRQEADSAPARAALTAEGPLNAWVVGNGPDALGPLLYREPRCDAQDLQAALADDPTLLVVPALLLLDRAEQILGVLATTKDNVLAGKLNQILRQLSLVVSNHDYFDRLATRALGESAVLARAIAAVVIAYRDHDDSRREKAQADAEVAAAMSAKRRVQDDLSNARRFQPFDRETDEVRFQRQLREEADRKLADAMSHLQETQGRELFHASILEDAWNRAAEAHGNTLGAVGTLRMALTKATEPSLWFMIFGEGTVQDAPPSLLTKAIEVLIHRAPTSSPRNSGPRQFANALVKEAGVRTAATVDLDMLGHLAQKCCREPKGSETSETGTRLAEMLSRSMPALSGEVTATGPVATAAALASLCLAVEVGEDRARADSCRQLALGAAFLARRASGAVKPDEVLLLAVDRNSMRNSWQTT